MLCTSRPSTASPLIPERQYQLTGDQAWRRDYYYDGPGGQAVVNFAYAMEHAACEETGDGPPRKYPAPAHGHRQGKFVSPRGPATADSGASKPRGTKKGREHEREPDSRRVVEETSVRALFFRAFHRHDGEPLAARSRGPNVRQKTSTVELT